MYCNGIVGACGAGDNFQMYEVCHQNSLSSPGRLEVAKSLLAAGSCRMRAGSLQRTCNRARPVCDIREFSNSEIIDLEDLDDLHHEGEWRYSHRALSDTGILIAVTLAETFATQD